MVRNIIFLVLILLSSVASGDTIHVVVMAGQSNMVGAAPSWSLPVELQLPQEDVLYQYFLRASDGIPATDDWIGLAPRDRIDGAPVKQYASEITFGRRVADVISGHSLAIVKVAANGTSLWYDWNPARPDGLYNDLTKFVNQVSQQLVDQGHEVQMDGFVWVQGSGDATTLSAAVNYGDRLSTLVESLRTEWNEPDLPVMFNQLHVNTDRLYVDELRLSQAAYAELDPRAFMVNVDDLALHPDFIHFQFVSQQDMGYRLADSFFRAKLAPGDVPSVPEPSTFALVVVALLGLVGYGWRRRRAE